MQIPFFLFLFDRRNRSCEKVNFPQKEFFSSCEIMLHRLKASYLRYMRTIERTIKNLEA